MSQELNLNFLFVNNGKPQQQEQKQLFNKQTINTTRHLLTK